MCLRIVTAIHFVYAVRTSQVPGAADLTRARARLAARRPVAGEPGAASLHAVLSNSGDELRCVLDHTPESVIAGARPFRSPRTGSADVTESHEVDDLHGWERKKGKQWNGNRLLVDESER